MPERLITPAMRIEIRKRYADGQGPALLAQQFGIARSTVHHITRGLPRQRQAITSKTIVEIRDLLAQGYQRRAVAERLRVSVTAVANYDIRQLPSRRLTPATVRQIHALLAQGNSRRAIAEITGVSVTTVRKYDSQQPTPKSAATRRRTAAPASRPEQPLTETRTDDDDAQ